MATQRQANGEQVWPLAKVIRWHRALLIEREKQACTACLCLCQYRLDESRVQGSLTRLTSCWLLPAKSDKWPGLSLSLTLVIFQGGWALGEQGPFLGDVIRVFVEFPLCGKVLWQNLKGSNFPQKTPWPFEFWRKIFLDEKGVWGYAGSRLLRGMGHWYFKSCLTLSSFRAGTFNIAKPLIRKNKAKTIFSEKKWITLEKLVGKERELTYWVPSTWHMARVYKICARWVLLSQLYRWGNQMCKELAKVTHWPWSKVLFHGWAEIKAQISPKCISFLSVHTTVTSAILTVLLTSWRTSGFMGIKK